MVISWWDMIEILAPEELIKHASSMISEFNGVWANAENLETCREELREVLEEWILLRVSKNLPIPEVGGIKLKIDKVDNCQLLNLAT